MSDPLAGCLPGVEDGYNAVAAYAASLGIAIGVADYGGLRTEAETATILADRQNDYDADLAAGVITSAVSLDQYRPISPFGSSFHNYGAAFDVGNPDGSALSDHTLTELGENCPDGFRWGGNFPTPDLPHYELAMTLTDAQAAYEAQTGDSIAGGGDDGADLAAAAVTADGEDLSPIPWGWIIGGAGVLYLLWPYLT